MISKEMRNFIFGVKDKDVKPYCVECAIHGVRLPSGKIMRVVGEGENQGNHRHDPDNTGVCGDCGRELVLD